MPGARSAIGQSAAVIMTAFLILPGIGLIVMSPPSFWRAGLGVLLFGQGVRHFSFSPSLTTFRARLGLAVVRGMQLWCASYVVAGCLFFIAAVTSLEWVPAAILGFAAFCWIWMWTWFLLQSRHWTEPGLPVPPGAPR